MKTSSYIQLAKSTLFVSVLTLAIASCGKKETVEPVYRSETSSIRQHETVKPFVSDHKVVTEELKLQQLTNNEMVSTDVIIPSRNRFAQVLNDENISTSSIGHSGNENDVAKFKQIGIAKKNSTLSIGPGTADVSKFRQIGLAKKNSTL